MRRAFNIIFGVLVFVFLVYSSNIIGGTARLFYANDKQNGIMLSYGDEELFSPKRIEELVGSSSQIPFNTMTPFDWDTLYVVLPYTSDLKMIKLFGFQPKMLGTTSIYLNDNQNLLVFMKDDKIVVYGEVSNKYLQFQHYDAKNKRWIDKYPSDICIQNSEGELYAGYCKH